MRKTNLTGLLILLLYCTGYGQDTKKPTTQGWESLTESNYSIRYPAGWTLDQSQQMGTRFIVLGPLASPEDQFRENVNLIIQDLSAYDLDLDQYVTLSEEQIETTITNASIQVSERMKRDGSAFQRMIYTGQQGIFDLKFEQYYWVEDDKAYVLTFTAEADQFDALQPIGEEILDSFRIE